VQAFFFFLLSHWIPRGNGLDLHLLAYLILAFFFRMGAWHCEEIVSRIWLYRFECIDEVVNGWVCKAIGGKNGFITTWLRSAAYLGHR